MSAARLAPTRMNLLRAARRLERVRKGVDLLRRKREALVTELFKLARPAADARAQIGRETQRAYPALLRALATHGRAGLRALAWPDREILVEMEPGSVWGIAVSTIVSRPALARTLAARGTAPGGTGPAAATATARFEALAELLLDAAPREMLLRRLGEALSQTSRQVNTLEQRLAPGLEGQMHAVRGALDEREREERLRLRHLLRRRETVDSTAHTVEGGL
jgi:V/A-type H+-transporting ATPase subunit D